MPEPVPIRALHRKDVGDVVSALLELDPDDPTVWHVLFTNLDQRVPRSPASQELLRRLMRALDAFAAEQHAEARRLMAAARANRGRARRLREYVMGEVTGRAGLDRIAGVPASPKVASQRPIFRVVGGTAPACDRGSLPTAVHSPATQVSPRDGTRLDRASAAQRAGVREAGRSSVQALEAPGAARGWR